MNTWSFKRVITTFLLAAAVLVGIPLVYGMWAENDAHHVMVVQAPMTGDLTVYTEPGWKWTWWGTVTKYPIMKEFNFQQDPLVIQFYDGGHAFVKGAVSWEMPLDKKSIIAIHKAFGSPEGVETRAIRRAMESAAYFSGPTMSSLDSAAGKRNELLQLINEQMLHGVYKTQSKTMDVEDPITKIHRQVTAVEIVMGSDGKPQRAQDSYVSEFNIHMRPLTVSKMDYDEAVTKQIKTQQDAINQVTIAASNAKRAEQDAITAAAQGEAAAKKAEWEQKTIAAKSIADAQAKVTIAEANVKEAELYKKAETLRGEGEAARKSAVMAADGQLDKKLATYEKVMTVLGDSIAKAQPGAWSPQMQMGQASAGGVDRATSMIDILSAKAARDLGLDLSIRANTPVKK
jgi:regulator of protease activity HflC (stomatin/prohibitin superfamily)